ncbi:hypothetical protein Cgig2_004956 [Carnegiea gigantea]|uniref:Pentatricopeptide repeat-containing protein n=1 Tax=Carnegiea gigantea TaxID=171969 RepID=A0A9Q1L0X4_9CARY|nr:hypothetical protein Cgig2_004956 [Carnegiea gigantea]
MFDEMSQRNVVTWNSLISGYLLDGCPEKTLGLFLGMLREGSVPSAFGVSIALVGCSQLEDGELGVQVHGLSLKCGISSSVVVGTCLVDMYTKCWKLEEARRVFDWMQEKNVITWTAMVSGYAHNELPYEAMNLSREMQRLALKSNQCFFNMRNTGIAADVVTVTSVFRAIGVISALDVGKQVHALAFKIGCASNLYAQNGLVSMYEKCGSINNAKRAFLTMKERDLISWNSLIAGYSQHGYTEEVIELFEEMRRTRIQPDNATFTTVISACSRTGLIGRGFEYFNILRKRDPFETLSVELYTSVVDMLGRAGYVNEAEAFVNSMPIQPGHSVYKSLLSACKVHGNIEVGARLSNMFFEQYPHNGAAYVLLSNALSTQGSWEEVEGIWKLLQHRKVEKEPGYSSVE